MKSIFAAMSAILRAIGNSTRWVYERCQRTGNLIGRLVMAPFQIAAGMDPNNSVTYPIAPENPYEDAETAKIPVDLIKRIATQLLVNELNKDDAKALPRKVARWLSVLDRKELARVVCASHKQLESHLFGHSPGIDFVVPFTAEAIEGRKKDLLAEERMRRAETAERKRRLEKSKRPSRQIEEGARRLKRNREEDLAAGLPVPGYGV